ncbi:MAG: hypothetical protein ACKOXB_06230 [Flavobacteriales bacterium]
MEQISEQHLLDFKNKGYLVLKQVLEPSLQEVFERYVYMQRFNNHYLDDSETHSKWCYADTFGESILVQLQPLMEKISGVKLFPTNSVLRIYQEGGILRKHIDRDTCEYSVTLTVGYEAAELYPIWVRSNKKDIPVYLDRGDILIYKGCEVPHWREEFTGRSWAQLFLHYVDVNGKNAQHKFDGRLSVGMNNGKILAGEQVK